MNKTIVDEEIEIAREALIKCEIAESNKINSTYRGYVSTFGAALTMGSVESAIAFFSKDGNSTKGRTKLLKAIVYILNERNITKEKELIIYASNSRKNGTLDIAREEIINATIAVKLAMNLFELVKDK